MVAMGSMSICAVAIRVVNGRVWGIAESRGREEAKTSRSNSVATSASVQ
jgi:hypothetical protein